LIQLFELSMPAAWLLFVGALAARRQRTAAWQLAAFWLLCFVAEAFAITFGEYCYGPFAAVICPALPQSKAIAGCLPAGPVRHCLPLAIPCLEGLIFGAAWLLTQRRELRRWLRPLAAALVTVVVDLCLDPLLATSGTCGTAPPSGVEARGAGLWHWRLDPADPGLLFGIPIDNFLAWLATCLGFGLALTWAGTARWRRWLAAPLGLLGGGLLFALLDVLVTPPELGGAARVGVLAAGLAAGVAWLLARAFSSARAGAVAADPWLEGAALAALGWVWLYGGLALARHPAPAELAWLWLLAGGVVAAWWLAPRVLGRAQDSSASGG
jgi:hypothetical protein